MKISFDIDGVISDPSVPTEQFVPWWKRWGFPEPVRKGSRAVMQELQGRGHEIWVYTSSFRSVRYLRRWWRNAMGIPLAGIVNQQQHDQTVGRHGPSKYPPAFGIDLHVDDSKGVAIEGTRLGFAVLVIEKGDVNWMARVLDAVERKSDTPGNRRGE